MSEQIKHECGIALLRLLKPLEYYVEKYGTAMYGLNKMYLLMEKQHNRGQDGAGLASIKFDMEPGREYIHVAKSASSAPIKDVFGKVNASVAKYVQDDVSRLRDAGAMKQHTDYVGELYLGHLRYGTFGTNNPENTHPFVRENNWPTRNLVIAGNFNLTNVDELFEKLVSLGQHPLGKSDSITVLEKIGKFLDDENERQFRVFKDAGHTNVEITKLLGDHMDIKKILTQSSKYWDGGYVIGGLMGHGDAFVMRDPAGIRPAFYYQDDEVVVVASERAVIQTAFNVFYEDVKEIHPGNALIIRKNGKITEELFQEPANEPSPCSFERIYFSRGTDADIYKERKTLGCLLAEKVLKITNYDFENTVYSYIPNTAQVAFRGLLEGVYGFCREVQKDKILQLGDRITSEALDNVLKIRPRVENVAVKDVKMRTFISQDDTRDDMVAHVYDVTYGVVRDNLDTLVVVDDSIVRGTTLRQTILRILDRLLPKEIVVVSSAPQIRYPDCYGIDMAKIGDLVAFQAAIALLHETKQQHIINDVYKKCKAQEHLPKEEMVNHVREIYKPFTPDQITAKIVELLTPADLKASVKIVFQSIEDLHKACPKNHGDWYFTGKYPTPGGNKVSCKSFINYIENNNQRAY